MRGETNRCSRPTPGGRCFVVWSSDTYVRVITNELNLRVPDTGACSSPWGLLVLSCCRWTRRRRTGRCQARTKRHLVWIEVLTTKKFWAIITHKSNLVYDLTSFNFTDLTEKCIQQFISDSRLKVSDISERKIRKWFRITFIKMRLGAKQKVGRWLERVWLAMVLSRWHNVFWLSSYRELR